MTASSNINSNTNLNSIVEICGNFSVEVGELSVKEKTVTGKHTRITAGALNEICFFPLFRIFLRKLLIFFSKQKHALGPKIRESWTTFNIFERAFPRFFLQFFGAGQDFQSRNLSFYWLTRLFWLFLWNQSTNRIFFHSDICYEKNFC